MAKVEKFYPANAADKADNVLEQALGVYESVLIIGKGSDGELDFRATNDVSDAEAIFLVESFKHLLLASGYADGQ